MRKILDDPARSVEVNGRSGSGETPLMVAIRHAPDDPDAEGVPTGIELLLEHGADPNASRNDGATVLALAIERGTPDIVDRLLGAGARPTDRDRLVAQREWRERQDMREMHEAVSNRPPDAGWTAETEFAGNQLAADRARLRYLRADRITRAVGAVAPAGIPIETIKAQLDSLDAVD